MDSEYKAYRGKSSTTLPGLRRVRMERGLTQGELSALAGLSRFVVPRVETGGSTSLGAVDKLAQALRVDSLEELLRVDAPGENDTRRSVDHDKMVAWKA
jgi:predicted transcriptional regulator